MRDVRKIRSLVKAILIRSRKARNSDKELYIQVVQTLTPEFLEQPLIEALRNKELPNYDTVTRTRRWAQEHIEGTQADEVVEEAREVEEENYREEFS